jgi:hypothetical protein
MFVYIRVSLMLLWDQVFISESDDAFKWLSDFDVIKHSAIIIKGTLCWDFDTGSRGALCKGREWMGNLNLLFTSWLSKSAFKNILL